MREEMLVLPALKVMGHRTSKEVGNNCNNLNRLIALDAVTQEPVDVMWMYEGETTSVTGSGFIDVTSQKVLNVSAEGYSSVRLRAVNVSRFQDYPSEGALNNAMLVVKDDQTLDGWGPNFSVSSLPVEENHDVIIVQPGSSCATALRSDHSIFAWGNPKNGGELKIPDAERTDVKDIQMDDRMGLLLGSAIRVVSQWGADSAGTNKVPDDIANRTDIQKVLTNGSAQIALTQTGQILEWGANEVFRLPTDIAALKDIRDIYISDSAAIALRKTGQLVAWGNPQTGGVLPDDIAALNDVERVIPGYESFVALRKNGGLACWGQNFELPASMKLLTGIVQAVYGLSEKPLPYAYEGCAVLDSTGQVYSWYGPGVEVSVPAALSDVVALTTNAFYSFAALKSDGSVVAWGTDISGDTTPVNDLLTNVQAIYPMTQGYLALRVDGTMVAWGNPDIQSDNASIPAELQGMVTYQY